MKSPALQRVDEQRTQGRHAEWQSVCELDELLPQTGICAWLDGRQIAIFRIDECVYAIDNHDPASNANVLSRGIVGDVGGELVVASPLYKHHYSLITGRCLEDAEHNVAVYPAHRRRDHMGTERTGAPESRAWQAQAGCDRQRHGRHAYRR
jgi:NAD(P)H-dependent nitrite reductase small subunit